MWSPWRQQPVDFAEPAGLGCWRQFDCGRRVQQVTNTVKDHGGK
jgi:hypothetical protein